jgi:hypothetical protein
MVDMAKWWFCRRYTVVKWPRCRDAGDDDDKRIMHGLAGSATNDLARRVLLTSLLELGVAGCHSQKEDAVVNTSSAI